MAFGEDRFVAPCVALPTGLEIRPESLTRLAGFNPNNSERREAHPDKPCWQSPSIFCTDAFSNSFPPPSSLRQSPSLNPNHANVVFNFRSPPAADAASGPL